MGLITKPNTFSAGAVIIASEHNSNFDVIYNEFNGNISNANIDANAAIVDTKLAQITTANKVSTSAITNDSLDVTDITMDESSSAPSTGADEGVIYTKESGGKTELFFREESDGTEVQITSNGTVGTGKLLQSVIATNVTSSTLSTSVPQDDTIPQITEGDQILSRAITPGSTSNNLMITVVGVFGNADAVMSLYNTDIHATNSQATARCTTAGASDTSVATINILISAPVASATTFTVRAGNSGGDTVLNGNNGGRLYGGAMTTSITITEIAA